MVILRENVRPLIIKIGGTPTFTSENYRSRTFSGYELRLNETFVNLVRVWDEVASPLINWVTTPLYPGDTERVVNAATGFVTPFDVLAGYELEVFLMLCNRSEAAKVRAYVDGQFAMVAVTDQRCEDINQPAVTTSTATFDPDFEFPHTYDLRTTNQGYIPMTGREWQVCILREMGTEPLPKEVLKRCKWCGKTQLVNRNVTRLKCSNPECIDSDGEPRETWYWIPKRKWDVNKREGHIFLGR